ncbi:TPA: aminoglycoside phosphotransferase family protein [Legionella pneumophila]
MKSQIVMEKNTNTQVFQDLLNKIDLGRLIEKPYSFNGGALHKVYKLKTDKGIYAVKQLNSYVAAKPNFKKSYELSELIAYEFAKINIPAVHALSFNNEFVITIHSEYFILYPYVDGSIIKDIHLSINQIDSISSIYSAMHSANLQISGVDTAHYDYFEDDYWIQLITQTQDTELIKLIPEILRWNQMYYAYIPDLRREEVISHRDMHIQNVLWTEDKQPHIIDWECAGLMNPMMEVIGYGLEWSGIILNQDINFPLLERLLTQYFKTSTLHWSTSVQHAFYGWLGHCVFAWTELNIRRMLGKVSVDAEEIEQGRTIIKEKMIPCLNFIRKNEQKIIDSITSYT